MDDDVVITVQMNLIVICERILDLDGSWCQVILTLFWRGLGGHVIIFCIVFQM